MLEKGRRNGLVVDSKGHEMTSWWRFETAIVLDGIESNLKTKHTERKPRREPSRYSKDHSKKM